MKKKILIIIIVSLIMIGAFAAFLFFMSRDSKKIKNEMKASKNSETGILELEGDQLYKSFSTDTGMKVLNVSGPETNVLTFDHPDAASIYNPEVSAQIRKQLTRMASKKPYTFESPLIAYNPYGTNSCSLYIYFETDSDSYLKYTVTVSDETIPDFNRTMTDSDGSGYMKHEYELTGLVPGMTNYIKIELCSIDGDYIDSKIYQIDMPKSLYGSVSHIVTEQNKPIDSITNGLFFCYGTDTGCIPVYDNSGCLRGEIPLISNNNMPVIVGSANMILACSDNSIVRVTQSGQVISNASTGNYKMSSDMSYNGMGQVLAIASDGSKKSKKDQVLSIDMETGNVTVVADMRKLLKKQFKQSGKKNWLGLDSIEFAEPGDIILGASEVSGIFRISNILTANPTLKYIIGDNQALSIKGLMNKVYKKTALEVTASPEPEKDTQSGNSKELDNILDIESPEPEPFEDMYGNVSVHYETAKGLDEASPYYLYLMNNNNGQGTQFWKYYVDEETGTYLLRIRCTLPNNANGGSVMENAENIIAMTPSEGKFGEYKVDGTVISKYALTADSVDKFTMKGFWFQ